MVKLPEDVYQLQTRLGQARQFQGDLRYRARRQDRKLHGHVECYNLQQKGEAMIKPANGKSAYSGQFLPKSSVSTELATFRSVVSKLKEKPEVLRAIAMKAGITTAAGNLTKLYKSK